MENLTLTNTNLGIPSSAAVKAAPQQTEIKVKEVAPRVQAAAPDLNLRQRAQSDAGSVEQRLALLKRLANLYAVSDTRFTIYKQNGEYYTRITNLRDGRVTTVPEPTLLTQLGAGSLLETSV